MPKETRLRTRKQIQADNAAFEKLSPAKKRVAIVRDALAQLGNRLIAEHKVYVSAPSIAYLLAEKPKEQLQKVFNKMEECNVCAKGALFICLVDRANALRIDELSPESRFNGMFRGGDVDGYLPTLFSDSQLQLIEIAFEGRSYGDSLLPENSPESVEDARSFYEVFKYSDDEADSQPEVILRAIFENMIVNKGTFKPEILPVKRWVTKGFRG